MDLNVIQIWNKDQNHLLATVMTVPEYRYSLSEKTEFQFTERADGSPMAITSWFNVGDSVGHALIYPKEKTR